MKLIKFNNASIVEAQIEMVYIKQDLQSKDGTYQINLRSKTAGETELYTNLTLEEAQSILAELEQLRDIRNNFQGLGQYVYKIFTNDPYFQLSDKEREYLNILCTTINTLKNTSIEES